MNLNVGICILISNKLPLKRGNGDSTDKMILLTKLIILTKLILLANVILLTKMSSFDSGDLNQPEQLAVIVFVMSRCIDLLL